MVEVWNNPSCSKCAAARGALDGAGVAYTLRDYLTDPPGEAELADVLRRIGAEPWDIARLGEPVASELGLADEPRDRAAWIAILAAHPILIQRPILLLDDGTAVIGRSAGALQAALDVCPLPPSR